MTVRNGFGIRVNTRKYTVNSLELRVDSAYKFKVLVTSPPSYATATLPG